MGYYEIWEKDIDKKIKERKNELLSISKTKIKESADREAELVLRETKQKLSNWNFFGIHESDFFINFFTGEYDKNSSPYKISELLGRVGLIDVWGDYSYTKDNKETCVKIASVLKEHIDTLYVEDDAYQHFLDGNIITKRQRLRNVFEENSTKEEVIIVITEEQEEEISDLVRMIWKEMIDLTFLQKENVVTILHQLLQLREYPLYQKKKQQFPQIPSYYYLQRNIAAEHFQDLIEKYKQYALEVTDQKDIDECLLEQIQYGHFDFINSYLYISSDPKKIRKNIKEQVEKNIEEYTKKIEKILLLNEFFTITALDSQIEYQKELAKASYEALEQIEKDES